MKTFIHGLSRQKTNYKILFLSCVTIWAWIFFAAVLNESQLNDSLEQFIWAQSFELGYWKHPPLTTWLMYGLIHTFGPSHLWTYALSAVLYTITTVATYKIAEWLFDSDVASLTALLLTLHYGFTRRAQLYNHNSVLIAFIAVTVLIALLALREKKLRYWLLLGLFSGLSLGVKYQAIVPLSGLVLAIVLTQRFNEFKAQAFWAFVIGLITFSPHLYWVVQHEFSTVNYALNYVDNSEFGSTSSRTTSFFVAQLRYYIPAIFFVFFLWSHHYITKIKPSLVSSNFTSEQRGWFIGLVVFPFVLIVFCALAMGVRLQSQWGLQTTQFLSIFIAYWVLKKFGPVDSKKITIWLGIQSVALLIFIAQGMGILLYARDSLAVRELPARKMADEAQSFWSSKTACPLKYLSGQSSMSAMIAAYADRNMVVLEDGDFTKSPWVDKADMEKNGYLEVSVSMEPSSEPDTRSIGYHIKSRHSRPNQTGDHLILKFHKPQIECP